MQLTNNIKKTFLSFAQQYFKTVHPTLTWNPDPRLTKIFIADKFVASPAIIEKMPAIILSRGPVSYAQTSIDQMQSMDLPYGGSAKQRTDLVRGTITYNCTSQNGIEAEEIANTLYLNLVGFKDTFRSKGIHQILGISMGEEQVVRGDVVPRLFMVPINISYTTQTTIVTSDDYYSCIVTLGGNTNAQLNNVTSGLSRMSGYTISGQNLLFMFPPESGLVISVDYTGRYSLINYTDVTPAGVVDGVNYTFILPEEVYTPYYTLSGVIVYATTTSGIYS